MTLPPLNKLSPFTVPLLAPAQEALRAEAAQNVGQGAKDSVELSMRAEQLLSQNKTVAQATSVETDAALPPAERTEALIDSVTISPQGREALGTLQNGNQALGPTATQAAGQAADARGGEQAKNVLATATLNSGASVYVYATTYAEGEEKPFFLAPDQKVMAQITRADGSTETLAIRGNTIISEDEQGNLLVQSGPEKYKTSDRNEILHGTDGNDVIINLYEVDEIHAGKGNDTIISFDDIQRIDLGDGDNSVRAQGGTIGSISATNGNNTISNVVAGDISLGDGDNTLIDSDISRLFGGHGNNSISGSGKVREMRLGDGDNSVAVDSADMIQIGNGNNSVKISRSTFFTGLFKTPGPEIRLGDGDNMVEVEAARLIQAGNGHNTVKINSHTDLEEQQHVLTLKQKIQLGDGDNVVSAHYASEITLGNGDNKISGSIYHMTVGNGNNAIDAQSLLDGGEWLLGNGKNHIHINTMHGMIKTGDGDNTFVIDAVLAGGNSIKTGSGNDSVHLRGDVYGFSADLGDGDNQFMVDGNVAFLNYAGGDGQDTVMIKGFLAHSMVRTGKGDDTVAVEGFIFKSLIDSGLGDNTLNLNRLVIDSMINGNATGEVSEEEKAAVLDVLDRFMARWNTPNKAEAVVA